MLAICIVAAAIVGIAIAWRRRLPTPAIEDAISSPATSSSGHGTRSQGVVAVPGVQTGSGRSGRATSSAPAGAVAILDVRMDDHVHMADAPAAERYDNGRNGHNVATASTAGALAGERIAPPSHHRLSGAALAAIAAAVGLAAIGMGGWAFAQSVRDDETQPAASVTRAPAVEQVVSLMARPTTDRIPLRNSVGRIVLVVGAKGYGVLVLDGLSHAPAGKSYQAWVIRPGEPAPLSAAVFSGREVVVPLTTLVPKGGTVAITLERAGGVQAPTRAPKLTAQRT
jgi:anti-sigma-K factor RskA